MGLLNTLHMVVSIKAKTSVDSTYLRRTQSTSLIGLFRSRIENSQYLRYIGADTSNEVRLIRVVVDGISRL